jgi:hypothetical protein
MKKYFYLFVILLFPNIAFSLNKLSAKDFVNKIYTDEIKNQKSYDQNVFSKEIRSKLGHLTKSADDGSVPDCMDFDPLVNGQDIPYTFSISRIDLKSSDPQIVVKLFWEVGNLKKFNTATVILTKEKNKFKIKDIIHSVALDDKGEHSYLKFLNKCYDNVLGINIKSNIIK